MTDIEIAILAAKQFNKDSVVEVEPYGEGHINTTYSVIYKTKNKHLRFQKTG